MNEDNSDERNSEHVERRSETKTKNEGFLAEFLLWFNVKREGFNSRFIFVLPLTFCHACLLRFASSPCHPCLLDAHCDWYRLRRRSTRFGNLHLTFLSTRRVCRRRAKKERKRMIKPNRVFRKRDT